MKKCFAMAAALLLAFTMAFQVSAATLNILPDAAQGAITVSGELEAVKGNATVMLRFLDESEQEIFVDFTKSKRTGDKVTYTFDKLYLPSTLDNGTYIIEVSCVDLAAPLRQTYVYSDPFKVLAALRAVEEASGTQAGVGAVLTENGNERGTALGLDLSDYESFTANPKAKAAFEAIMQNVTYQIPEGANDTSQNERELNRLKAAFKAATAAGLFVAADSEADVAAWLTRYYDDTAAKQDPARDESTLGPDPDANLCIKNEDTEFAKLFAKSRTDADFVNRVIKAEGIYTIAEIADCLNRFTLLSVICEETDSEALDVLEDYPGYFQNVNWSGFQALGALNQPGVLSDFSGVSYADCNAAVSAFNQLISSATVVVPGGVTNPVSTAGTGSGLKINNSALENTEKAEDNEVFNDLSHAEWAREAILYLHGLGVVNGRADGGFAPNDTVTRAEFIKMVVNALKISTGQSGSSFADVGTDAWYAPYAAAAERSGLITGDANGCFCPNDEITRQDMVTILFRALGEEADESPALNFTDADSVSGYARAAVAYFTGRGIVNGMGDGSFGARSSATRAQTAAILYKLMND